MIEILSELTSDFQKASKGMLDDALVNRGAKWIEALRKESPYVYGLITAFLRESPEKVLHALIPLLPELSTLRGEQRQFALKYIGLLQEKLLNDKARVDRSPGALPG